MADIDIGNFGGEKPGLSRLALNIHDAQIASNTKLWRGVLESLRDTAVEQAASTVGTPGSIFKYSDTHWFEWTASYDVDVVRSPVPDDDYGRVYYTGHVMPKVTAAAFATSGPSGPYPTTAYQIGVPAPLLAPSVTLQGTADDPEDIAESRFYVVTYVNAWGEEGPPSPVSAEVEWRPGQSVQLTNIPTAPGGSYYPPTFRRIYRSAGSGASAAFLLVAEIADMVTTTYVDSIAAEQLGTELITAEFDPPPTTLRGLVEMPGGIIAGFTDTSVRFCEPGLAYAWPERYALPVYGVVGLAVYGNTLMIATKADLMVATGVHPSAMAVTKTPVRQACVSKLSIADLGRYILYASPDGLVAFSGTEASVITDGVFDRDAWQALNPSSIRAAAWEGLYIGFYNNGTPGAFVFNPEQPDAGVVFLDAPSVGGRYFDQEDDVLYIASSSNILRWDAGDPLAFVYRSGPIAFDRPKAMTVARVFSEQYPVELRLYRDGVLQAMKTITTDEVTRISSPKRGRVYDVELQGTGGGVRRVMVSGSARDLAI